MTIWVIPFSPAVGFALIIQGVRLDAIGNTNFWSFYAYIIYVASRISYHFFYKHGRKLSRKRGRKA